MAAQGWQTGLIAEGAPTSGAKTAGDYLRGVRRRWWLVLLVTLVVGGGGAAFTEYQRPVYLASARVLLEPPRAIIQGVGDDRMSNPAVANFYNTRLQMIGSRQIAERVLNTLRLSEWDELHGVDDPVGLLQGWLMVRPVQNSNLVDVSIEGGDPALVEKIVNTTIDEFIQYEGENLRDTDQLGRSRLDAEIRGLEGMVNTSRQALSDFRKKNPNFLDTGQSVESARLAVLEEVKAQLEIRVDAARRDRDRFEAMRKAGVPFLAPGYHERAYRIREEIAKLDEELAYQKDVLRPEKFETDRAIRTMLERREKLEKSIGSQSSDEAKMELERLRQDLTFAEADLEHIKQLAEHQKQAVLGQQEEQAQLLGLQSENSRVETYRDFLARKRIETEVLQGLTTPRYQVIDRAIAPTSPVRPIKYLQIPLLAAAGLVLGVLSAVGLEVADTRARRPEQAAAWLQWPLLGIVPRIGWWARRKRGGRRPLVATFDGAPAAEAFRALRAGLVTGPRGDDCRVLLLTSAGPGEGRSLVAANLAATCGRAGERVLLIDADLCRHDLEDFFPFGGEGGLIEALEGQIPWQAAQVETDVPNLSFLATGRVAGVSPDVLGTREMLELIEEVGKAYDRVIIDAPEVLGRADSRVLASFVDAVVLVVRAGWHGRRPLDRVKEVFDHESVEPLGFVFNGMAGRHDDQPRRVGAPRAHRGVSKRREPVLAKAS